MNTEQTVEEQHAEMVSKLTKPAADIAKHLFDYHEKAHLAHMVLGVASEAGEIADVVKRLAIYEKHPLDFNKEGVTFRENMIEELGDMEFYLQGIRESFNITREETLEYNVKKLLKGRYKSGSYSDKEATERADKLPAYKSERPPIYEPM